jgi:hypothetical protein
MAEDPTTAPATEGPGELGHAYYAPQPGTAWAHVDASSSLLPAGRPLVTLANWQEPPYHSWAFQHMREIMPSHVVDGSDSPRPLPENPQMLGAITASGFGARISVDDLVAATDTDAFLVVHDGLLVTERYQNGMTRRRRHLVMSVTKSVVSCVAASLAHEGLLDPDAPATQYVPELERSGYAGASLRALLDMRTGVRFSEAYLDPGSEVRVMERSMGWAPRNHGDPLGMYPYILTIRGEQEHGGTFVYRSIDSDVLGWVCERATGQRMADLVAARVWEPMGAFHDAEFAVDPLGTAIHDGGLSATARDLARFGLLLLDGGSVGSRQIIPAMWLRDALYPPADIMDAFAGSASAPYLPGGWYRNQFWFVPGDEGPIMLALGIHGQMLFVEPSTRTVGVKLSSWAAPQDPARLHATIESFRAIGRALA